VVKEEAAPPKKRPTKKPKEPRHGHRKAKSRAAPRQNPINDLEPLDLLKKYGCFSHAQALGKILGYDPEIKTGRLTLKLGQWNYAKAHETEQEVLEGWTRQPPGFEAIVEELMRAATPSWKNTPFYRSKHNYRTILLDIRQYLKLPGYPTESYEKIESQILSKLMEPIREKYSKMSEQEKAKFRKSIEDHLRKEGKTLGRLPLEQVLWAGGGAGLISVLGAEVAAGIILAHLGVGYAILLAMSLYAVPVGLIGGVIFAPLAAAITYYFTGRANYSKTIPAVVTLATLRQQRLNAASSSPAKG
jgi:uncharacterized protein YaaW (UPF0174 family)